jgi:hypothetical protein
LFGGQDLWWMDQDFFDLHLKCPSQVSLVSNQSTCARNDINEKMGTPFESKGKKVSRTDATPLFGIVREAVSSRLGRAHGTASIWNQTSHIRKVRRHGPVRAARRTIRLHQWERGTIFPIQVASTHMTV